MDIIFHNNTIRLLNWCVVEFMIDSYLNGATFVILQHWRQMIIGQWFLKRKEPMLRLKRNLGKWTGCARDITPFRTASLSVVAVTLLLKDNQWSYCPMSLVDHKYYYKLLFMGLGRSLESFHYFFCNFYVLRWNHLFYRSLRALIEKSHCKHTGKINFCALPWYI